LIGASIGAAIGGAVGYSYADNVTKRRQALEGKENDLDARINFARSVNEDTQGYNAKLENEINALEPKIDKLAARIKQNTIKTNDLKNEKEKLSKEVAQAENNLKLAETDLQGLKTFNAGQQKKSDELDGEIVKLEASVAKLRQNTTILASLSQRI